MANPSRWHRVLATPFEYYQNLAQETGLDHLVIGASTIQQRVGRLRWQSLEIYHPPLGWLKSILVGAVHFVDLHALPIDKTPSGIRGQPVM